MKIAVLFPGIGYHCDKPLLYYSQKLAAHYRYEVIRLSYTNLNKSIPEAFADAYAQTEKCLEAIDWTQYEEILFLSKSIGTAIAAAYAQKHSISCWNVYYTPLLQTFDFAPQSGIVFHGTRDPWAETALIEKKCQEHCLPLYIIDNTNHSLELQPLQAKNTSASAKTVDALNAPASSAPVKSTVQQNLHILETVMTLTEQYIAHSIYYRTLCADEISRQLFCNFIRRQNVVQCWRKINEKWVIRDDPFVDDWTEDDYHCLIQCLKNTLKTGGLVCGAFCGQPSGSALKGFVSVESALFGGHHKYLDLSSIHVSEDMRGMGIGKNLFHAAKDWARKKGAKKLYISAHSAVETQAFYRAMGCVEAQEYNQRHVESEPYDCQLECSLPDQNSFFAINMHESL